MAPIQVLPFVDDVWEEIVHAVSYSNRIVVLTGAGISTNSGVADFRSSNGLFTNSVRDALSLLWASQSQTIKKSSERASKTTIDSLNILEGIEQEYQKKNCRELFHDTVYASRSGSLAFHRLCALMRLAITDGTVRPGLFHRLLHELQVQNRLIYCLTQNIDGLETAAGLKNAVVHTAYLPKEAKQDHKEGVGKLVQLHGSLEDLVCRKCHWTCPWPSDAVEVFLQGRVTECPRCTQLSSRRERELRRPLEPGVLRPNVVLYGESHPRADQIERVMGKLVAERPNLLLIVGTSLATDGMKTLVQDIAKVVHEDQGGMVVYVNLTAIQSSRWDAWVDYQVIIDCDDWTSALITAETKVWQKLTSPVSRRKSVSSRRNELHPSTRNMERKEQDKVWLDAFY